MDDSISILKQTLEWKAQDQQVALATVVKTWGSAPRRSGSMMCINSNLEFQGSVSGGCVETAVIDQAMTVIKTGQAQLLEFGVSNEQAWEVGLACGGNIEIHVWPVTGAAVYTLTEVVELNQQNRALVLSIGLDQQAQLELLTDDLINSAVVVDQLNISARQALRSDRPVIVEQGTRSFLQPFNPEINVYIVGAVHISQQLIAMIQQLGFTVYVIDPRAAFATEQRFPNINLVQKWPNEFFAEQNLNHRSAVITLTHDPKFDDPALQSALNSNAFYIGALGSRKTHASRVERLRAEGFTESQLDRIDAPIGLDIKASNPAEIAVSIAAGLVLTLRQDE